MRLLFYSFCTPDDPSTQFRCYAMAKELQKHGIESDVVAGTPRMSITVNLARVLASLGKYDVVVFHRHGNVSAYFAQFVSAILGKRTILDFDDALFTFGEPGVQSAHRNLNRWFGYPVLDFMIKDSDAITVGSSYLAEYAYKLNRDVHIIPTAIDTTIFRPLPRDENTVPVIGWVGNAPNHIHNLELVVEPLREVAKGHRIKFSVVSGLGDHRIENMFPSTERVAVDYGLNTMTRPELVPALINDFDIALCPLRDTPFFRGTCAMKGITCMAMGIPVVASPVGEYRNLIRDGENGFLAGSSEEWVQKVEMLIGDKGLRERIGREGLRTVQEGYSLERVGKRFAELCYG